MSESTVAPHHNHLLASISEEIKQRIFPHLELVTLPLGKVIYESGAISHHVFFPTDSIISRQLMTKDGESAGISVVGNDGLVGLTLLFSDEMAPWQAIVQNAGQAYKLSANVFKEEFSHDNELKQLMLRFTQVLITQMSQTAACNRHHSIDQQLCRWILLALDRLPSNQLDMTHALIANMIGVRRESVTSAAGRLQDKGVIEYRRGHISVLDRPKLEELSCECYAVVKKETDRLLPH